MDKQTFDMRAVWVKGTGDSSLQIASAILLLAEVVNDLKSLKIQSEMEVKIKDDRSEEIEVFDICQVCDRKFVVTKE